MSKARDTVEALRTVLVDGDVTNANFTGADLEIGKGGTGASTAGAARTALGLAIGSDVQAFNSTYVVDADIGVSVQAFNAAIMVDGDIGTTVQAHDADTAKLDANANFTGTLQRGGTDVLVTGDVTNANFTGADLEISKGGTGASSAGAARTALGLAIGTDVQAYDATILVDGDIGTSVLAPNGSAANLTNLPAGGNVVDFVASGTLPNGSKVVLKTNGQIEVVAETSTSVSQSIPTASGVAFNSTWDSTSEISIDPNDPTRFIVVYKDTGNGNYGTVTLGTISGSTISFGSEYIFTPSSNQLYYVGVAFDKSTKGSFLLIYGDNRGNGGFAKVGTVATNGAITFGSEVTWSTTDSTQIRVESNPNVAGQFVIAYADNGNSGYLTSKLATVTGTSVSSGSAVVVASLATYHNQICFDPASAGRFAIFARHANSASYGKSIAGTITGSSLSYGSASNFSTGQCYDVRATATGTANKYVVVYYDGADGSKGKAVVSTMSGSSMSSGSPVQFSTGIQAYYVNVSGDLNSTNKFVVFYYDRQNNNYPTVKVGTVSGTSSSFSSSFVINSKAGQHHRIEVQSNPSHSGQFVMAYEGDQPNDGRASLGQLATTITTTNLTATNFVGTSTAAYTNGQTATIMLQGGVSTNQTGLTIGSTYYVQPTGTLATTAGTPSVVAGKAVSATTLLLKGI